MATGNRDPPPSLALSFWYILYELSKLYEFYMNYTNELSILVSLVKIVFCIEKNVLSHITKCFYLLSIFSVLSLLFAMKLSLRNFRYINKFFSGIFFQRNLPLYLLCNECDSTTFFSNRPFSMNESIALGK